MIKGVLLFLLFCITSLASAQKSQTISSYYIKNGKKIFKPMKEKWIKPLDKKVEISEYKTPMIKGVILIYDHKR